MTSPWREASSLIVAAKRPSTGSSNSNEADFDLLLTKRSGKSSYLANAFCFPGGHIELADFSSDWWSLFRENGISKPQLMSLVEGFTGPRPVILQTPVATQKVDTSDLLPPGIALKIAALRETFEESGVLIAKSSSGSQVVTPAKDWQERVHKDASSFLQLFRELNAYPDVFSLKEWWNWLTPQALGHKRFDTMFYVCCLDTMPETVSDNNEVSQMEWLSPQTVLRLHTEGNAFLPPPQVYEMARLSNFTSLDQLRDFAHNREKLGVERWCANITGLMDGAILALPGDDFYDTVITSSGNQLPTLADVRNQSAKMNRMELRAPIFTPICANLALPCGHLCPVHCEIPDAASAALTSHL